METADLVLMPWIEARRRLGSREHTLRVLTPPYAAVGGGVLRVLRVRESGSVPLEITCGYERYRRS
jgi:hypothetical protein